jgi:uncharacterized protein
LTPIDRQNGENNMATELDERANPQLAKVVSRLVERFQPDFIYLFGSRARGDATENSDYDLLVIVPEARESGYERMRRANRVLRDLDLPTEVIVLSRFEFERDLSVVASLPATAVREGRLLYAA